MPSIAEAPLSEFHPEAARLVDAFRKSGARTFQDLTVPQSRAAYDLSCSRNGLPRRDLERVRDVVIRTPGHDVAGVRTRFYRWAPPDAGPQPGIVYLHGGGWVLGGLDTHDPICRELAHGSRATVVAIDYRLSPEHPFPAALEDCLAVVRQLTRHPEDFGLNGGPLVVAGDSAGANLAAVLALMSRDGVLPPLGAQVLFYPVTDLANESDSYARVTSGVPLTAASMRWFRDHYLTPEQNPADWRVSPLHAAGHAGLAPAFVVTVGHDPLADEGIAYAARLASAGTALELHHLPGHTHGVVTSGGLLSAAAGLLGEAAAFIRASWAAATPIRERDTQ